MPHSIWYHKPPNCMSEALTFLFILLILEVSHKA